MAKDYDRPRAGSAPVSTTPTAQELKGDIDSGRTGDKIPLRDPAAAPLGTDDEAAGRPDTPRRVATAIRQEVRARWNNGPGSSAIPIEGNTPVFYGFLALIAAFAITFVVAFALI